MSRPRFLAGIFAVCAITSATTPGRAQNLPDAPATHVPVPATRPTTTEAVKRRQWSGVVEPGEKIPPLTVHEKLLLPLHEELRPLPTLLPDLFSGVYGGWRNSDPKLGTNGEAFGKRVGEAALRQAISRELSDSLLPILLRQDPRYYRQAYGSYKSRTEHAVSRIFIAQTDTGGEAFNGSDVLGRGMAAALTQTYYPSRSLGAGVVFRTWGVSLAALGGGNLFQEFWPDAKRKLLHRSQ